MLHPWECTLNFFCARIRSGVAKWGWRGFDASMVANQLRTVGRSGGVQGPLMMRNQDDWSYEQREPDASDFAADGRGTAERKKGLACPLRCNGGADASSEQTLLRHMYSHHTFRGVIIPQWWLVLHDRWTCSGCYFLFKNSRKSCAR